MQKDADILTNRDNVNNCR